MTKDTKQTPKEKAEELMEQSINLSISIYKPERFAYMVCENVIETLSNMKGMGRISKLTFWKKVVVELDQMEL